MEEEGSFISLQSSSRVDGFDNAGSILGGDDGSGAQLLDKLFYSGSARDWIVKKKKKSREVEWSTENKERAEKRGEQPF